MTAKGTYSVKKWEENNYAEISREMKMSKASVVYNMSGEIEGIASVEYLLFYKYFDATDQHNSSAQYTGLIRFTGTINGLNGSFVMEDHGNFENGAAISSLRILQGSGQSELRNIQGKGSYSADKNGAVIELDYIF
ncbi:MAG: DUF3224 domain-containing protein [Bacillota bacterium]